MAVLSLENTAMDRVVLLLQTDATLAARQILKANSKDAITLPMLRLQAGTVGAHTQFAGSAKSGVWDVLLWVSAIGSRTDGSVDLLRDYIARARDVLFADFQASFTALNDTLFKVWNIEFEQVQHAQTDEHDVITLPVRMTCAAYSAATT